MMRLRISNQTTASASSNRKGNVSTASLLGAQYKRDSVENKPASSLVESLDKALNGTLPSLCGRHVVSKQCVYILPA